MVLKQEAQVDGRWRDPDDGVRSRTGPGISYSVRSASQTRAKKNVVLRGQRNNKLRVWHERNECESRLELQNSKSQGEGSKKSSPRQGDEMALEMQKGGRVDQDWLSSCHVPPVTLFPDV